jgi:hypothetical protein
MALLSTLDGMLGKLDEWYFRYHCYVNRHAPPLFHRGWGSRAAIEAVNRQWDAPQRARPSEVAWTGDWAPWARGLWTRTGSFPTPLHGSHLPPRSQSAYLQVVSPAPALAGPAVVMPPTSREAGVAARLPIARALAARGIASVLLESPYMGRRRPLDQHGTTLQYFSDFLVLSATAIEEARAVLAWLHERGVDRLGIAGISKGAYLATVAGLRSAMPVRVVALLPPDSGTAVLIDGLLGRLCDWEVLQRTSGSPVPVKQQVADVFSPTRLDRLPLPNASQRVTLVAARRDRYVPCDAYERLCVHWRGHADVRWLPGGHVSTIAERRHLIGAITDSLLDRPGDSR